MTATTTPNTMHFKASPARAGSLNTRATVRVYSGKPHGEKPYIPT
jgi:hypothetical protein